MNKLQPCALTNIGKDLKFISHIFFLYFSHSCFFLFFSLMFFLCSTFQYAFLFLEIDIVVSFFLFCEWQRENHLSFICFLSASCIFYSFFFCQMGCKLYIWWNTQINFEFSKLFLSSLVKLLYFVDTGLPFVAKKIYEYMYFICRVEDLVRVNIVTWAEPKRLSVEWEFFHGNLWCFAGMTILGMGNHQGRFVFIWNVCSCWIMIRHA